MNGLSHVTLQLKSSESLQVYTDKCGSAEQASTLTFILPIIAARPSRKLSCSWRETFFAISTFVHCTAITIHLKIAKIDISRLPPPLWKNQQVKLGYLTATSGPFLVKPPSKEAQQVGTVSRPIIRTFELAIWKCLEDTPP